MSESGRGADPVSGVGRHRAEPRPRSSLSRLIAPITAVAVVAAAVIVLIAVRGHSPGTGPGPGVIVAPTITTPGATSTATTTASSASSPSVSLTHPPPTPTPTLRPTHHKPAWKTAMADVRVYNTTHITGLAHRIAAEIAGKGWTVPVVGNIGATSTVTTLYYSPRAHDAARHLAHEFSGIRQIRPNSSASFDYNGLTLLITADWHD